MKLLFVYQNYYKATTGLGHTFERIFKDKLPGAGAFRITPVTKNMTANRFLNKIDAVKSFHFSKQNENLFLLVRRQQPDAIFILKGTDVHPQTLRLLKREFPGLVIACFNPDDPFNQASSNANILESIQFYDHYFIWANRLIKTILEAGAKACHYLPFGTDAENIKPNWSGSFEHDFTFIGNGDKERHDWIKAIAKELQNQKAFFNVSVFGANWPKIKGVETRGQLHGSDYVKCMTRSKININILRKQNKGSTNMRTFEIPAADGFMLHENSIEAQNIFIDGSEAAYYSSPEELVEKAIFYLDNEADRQKIASAGHLKATAYAQSYEARIDFIMQKLFSPKSSTWA